MATDRPVMLRGNRRCVPLLCAAALLSLVAFATVGCQNRWHYEWGSYQDSVWVNYAPNSDKGADIGKQIQTLTKEIKKAEAHTRPDEPSRVPPGKHAHLGYLYALQGDAINARQCMHAEKTLYPESSRFIDALLARMP